MLSIAVTNNIACTASPSAAMRNDSFAAKFAETNDPALLPARVIEELKGHYRVRADSGDYLVKISGSMRFGQWGCARR